MASTYTSNGIEIIGDGEQSNTWGDTTNTNWELMEEMVAGGVSIALTGTTQSLAVTDGATSYGRHAVVTFLGSPGGICTVTVSPNTVQKTYIIKNDSDETVTMSQGSGSTVDIAAGKSKIIFCDGAGSGAAVTDLSSGFDSTTLAELGITATAAELNIMDGVTATTAELNIMDGVTATTAEINVLDGFTGNTADLNVIAGAATSGGIGKVLQVVYANAAADVTITNSTTPVDSATASITPSSASSKVLVICNQYSVLSRSGANQGQMSFYIDKDGTAISYDITSSKIQDTYNNFGMIMHQTAHYLDSPATTSSVTYTIKARSENSTGTFISQEESSITLMEIAA